MLWEEKRIPGETEPFLLHMYLYHLRGTPLPIGHPPMLWCADLDYDFRQSSAEASFSSFTSFLSYILYF